MSSNSSLDPYAPIKTEEVIRSSRTITSDIQKLRIRSLEQAMAVRAVLCTAGIDAEERRKQLWREQGNPEERKAFGEYERKLASAIEEVNGIIAKRYGYSEPRNAPFAPSELVAEFRVKMFLADFDWLFTEEEKAEMLETLRNRVATAW